MNAFNFAEAFEVADKLLAPVSCGHLAGVDVDSAPKHMWTPCRS